MRILALIGHGTTERELAAQTVLETVGGARWDFAEPLRGECAEAFGVDVTLFTDAPTLERRTPALRWSRCVDRDFVRATAPLGVSVALDLPHSPRQILRWYDAWRRDCDPNCWWRHAVSAITRTIFNDEPLLVIPDVDYADDARGLRRWGAHFWRIQPTGPRSLAAHRAELARFGWPAHMTIPFNGDVEAFERVVRDCAYDFIPREVAR